MFSRRSTLALALAALVLPLPAFAATAPADLDAASLPDFRVVALDWTTPKQQGAHILVNATVHNAGGLANGTQRVGLYVDGTLTAVATLANPKPGANATVSLPWRVRSGTFTFEARADDNATWNETNESNNARAATITVPFPDLAVTELVIRSRDGLNDTLYEDEEYFVAFRVANLGALNSLGVAATLSIDGAHALSTFIPPLAPGESTERSLALAGKLGPGHHEAVAIVDANATVNESDEANNLATLAFEVTPLPTTDVRVRILGVERPTLRTDLGPIAPNPLARRTVLVELANVGDGPAFRGGYEVTLHDDVHVHDDVHEAWIAGETLARGAIPALAPGERVVLRIPWDPAGLGDVTITATATTGAQPDADPTNNADTHEDFILVGGLGHGVALFGRAPLP